MTIALHTDEYCVKMPCGKRNKIPQPVVCYCPCARYPHIPRQTTCSKCGHGHRPPDTTASKTR